MYVSHQLASADKRKSWTISIILHALIFLLCLLPFIVQTTQDNEFLQAITINFNEPVKFEDLSSKQSGFEAAAASAESSAAEATSDQPQEQETPREQVTLETVASIQPSTPMPTPTRTITMTEPTPEIILPAAKAPTAKSDRFFEQPLDVVERHEVDRVEAFKEKPNPNLQQRVTWHVSDNEASDRGAPTSFDFGSAQSTGSDNGQAKGTSGKAPDGQSEDNGYDPFASGTFPDGTGTGKGTDGKNTGVGDDGKGLNWGDFAGDGLFNRKVIKRANVARIALKQGKVVINLCVDQLGKVTFAQYDLPNSSIRDKTIVAKAEECAKQYVFDEDPSAPREQCGRLTFIFEIKM